MWSDWLVFCDCGFHSLCPLMEKDKRLMEVSWWERLTEGKTGSCSDEQGHAQKIFNPILLIGRAVFPHCCLTWGQTMVGVMKIMVISFKRSHACIATLSAPDTAAGHCQPTPLPTHTSIRASWTLTGKSGSVSCGVTAPFSWVLVCRRFCLCHRRVCFPSPV